jgi:hypothetical protein
MFIAIATLFAQFATVNNQQLEPWNGDYVTTCGIIYLGGIWQGLLVRTNTKSTSCDEMCLSAQNKLLF